MSSKLSLLFFLILFTRIGYTQQPEIDGYFLDSLLRGTLQMSPIEVFDPSLEAMVNPEYKIGSYDFGEGKLFTYRWAESDIGLDQISKKQGYPLAVLEKSRFDTILFLIKHYQAGDHIQFLREKELEKQIVILGEINNRLENVDSLRTQQLEELIGQYSVLRTNFDKLNELTASSFELNKQLDKKLSRRNKWNFVLASGLAAVLVTSILSITSN